MANGMKIESDLERLVKNNIFKNMSKEVFIHFKKAYLTYIMLNNADSRHIMQALGKIITKNKEYSSKELYKIIECIELEDCKNLLEKIGEKSC